MCRAPRGAQGARGVHFVEAVRRLADDRSRAGAFTIDLVTMSYRLLSNVMPSDEVALRMSKNPPAEGPQGHVPGHAESFLQDAIGSHPAGGPSSA